MKYLFIDTNIYIQCCLLELEGDGFDELKKMHGLLESKKINLLLPEVVELEFYKRLDNKVELLKKRIGEHKKNINLDSNLDDRVKKDVIGKLDDCISERERNKEKVKSEIANIFQDENTIRNELKLTPQIFIDSYKYFLHEEKPFKIDGEVLQSDCLIIETIKRYFEDKTDYELYFCSLNKWDFSSNPKEEDKKLNIHEDIKKKFNNITYYTNLFSLLNDKFEAGYSDKSIKKLKEKEEESRKIDFTDAGLVFGRMDATGKIYASNKEPFVITGNNNLSEMKLTGNERFAVRPTWEMGMRSPLTSDNILYFICARCSKVQFSSPSEDGLCDDCKRKNDLVFRM